MGMMMAAPESPGREPRASTALPPRHANIWLRLTSYGADWDILGGAHGTIEQRELVRRSRLASWLILGLLVLEVVLIPAGFTDPATLLAVLVALVGTVIAAVFNRFGKVSVAAIMMVVLTWGAVIGAVLGSQGGTLDTIYLPAYDLLVIPLAIAATLLRPAWLAFIMALVNCATMIVDFLYQPKTGDLAHQLATGGTDITALLARPIALQIIVATITFLVVQSSEQAIRRADRAEELAELERREIERTRELEEGVRQLLAVHVHLANGDFNVRSPAIRNSLLWQIGSSLNNLIARLGRLAQADFVLRRTQEEANRVTEAIYMINSGRQPIWPAPSNTPLDRLVDVLRSSLTPHAGPGGGPQAPHMPPMGQMSQMPQLPPSGGYPGMGPGTPSSSVPNPNSVMGVPDRPSAAYPASQGPANNAVPDWMRTLMPGDASGRAQPMQPMQPVPPMQPMQQAPQMPPMQPQSDPRGSMAGPASVFGGPIGAGPAPQPPQGDVNPWALEPGEPLDDNDLPEWLRQPNQ